MKETYVYVGSRGEVGDYVFTHRGQEVELDRSVVSMLVDAGIHLIPKADFVEARKAENPVRAALLAHDSFKESLQHPVTPVEETIADV